MAFSSVTTARYWNASTNVPPIKSGIGQTGSAFIVSVAGTTTVDGMSNWEVGDWIVFALDRWYRLAIGNSHLGTMASQDADDVNITGGVITGMSNVDSEVFSVEGEIIYRQPGGIYSHANLGLGVDALASFSSTTAKFGMIGIGYRSFQMTIDEQESTGIGYQTGQYNQGSYNFFGGYKAGNGSPANVVSNKGTLPNAAALPVSGNTLGDAYTIIDTKKLFIWDGSWVDYGVATTSRTVAIGTGAGRFMRTKSYGTIIGMQAAYSADADYLSVYGAYAGFNITTGEKQNLFGGFAGYNLTTGSENLFAGWSAGYSLTTNGKSVGLGHQALFNATGDKNLAVGHNSGSGITTGSKNVILGSYTGADGPIGATGSNFIVLSDGDANVRGFFDSAGNLVIGDTSTSSVIGFRFAKNLTGGINAYMMHFDSVVQSDVTASATGLDIGIGVAAGGSALPLLIHQSVNQGVFAKTVSAQYGYHVGSGLTGANMNYAFVSDLAKSGTARWNIFMTGDAPNFMAGNLAIGGTAFGTNAARVLSIATGTAPTTGPADSIQLYSTDLSAGNTMLSLFTEGTCVNANTGTTNLASRIAVRINGTVYYLLAASAP